MGEAIMGTSDAELQPSQAQLTLPDGHPTLLEEEMWAKAATGDLVDGGGGPYDVAAMRLWGEERTIVAAVLRDLLVGGQRPVHAKGVRLRGIRISGLLDLEGATLRCPLSFDSCYLDADDPACLDHAIASRVALTGCQLVGLTANMIKATEIDLTRSTLRTSSLSLFCANITGNLICSGAQLNGADDNGNALVASGIRVGGSLYLDDRFTAAGAVELARADIAHDLDCEGAGLGINRNGNALTAEGIRVGNAFLRERFTAEGAVRLLGAEIRGDLSCRAARLGSDHKGRALVAERMKVGGEVHLHKGFTTEGAVALSGSDITGDLSLSGAQLTGTDHDGNALVADGMKAGHDVLLDRAPADDEAEQLPFTAAGAVRLARADITGQLSCSGAQLTGTDHDGNALVADGMKAGAAVLLDERFTAAGTVSLNSARAHQLVLSPAGLADTNEITFNFTATEAQIAGVLRWSPDGQFSGRVNLEDAEVGELDDNWKQAHAYWPLAGRLRLGGFTYGGLGEASVKQRLEWIRSQYQGDDPAAFAAQPYEQLAAVFRQAGQDTEAREVAIARRRDLRKYGKLNWYRRFGNRFLDETIRYGYRTWRAAVVLAAVFVAFLLLSVVGQHRHVIVPIGDIKGLKPVPTATQCTSKYPCFYPFGYTIDTVIPIINVHQADYWGPDGHAPVGWLWIIGAWGATAAGWALATLLVAGYTGLVRQN
jgi:hypothetical protein